MHWSMGRIQIKRWTILFKSTNPSISRPEIVPLNPRDSFIKFLMSLFTPQNTINSIGMDCWVAWIEWSIWITKTFFNDILIFFISIDCWLVDCWILVPLGIVLERPSQTYILLINVAKRSSFKYFNVWLVSEVICGIYCFRRLWKSIGLMNGQRGFWGSTEFHYFQWSWEISIRINELTVVAISSF